MKSRLSGRWIQRNPADRWGRTSRWTRRTPVEDGSHIDVTPGDLNVETLTRVGWKRGDRDLMSPTRLLAHNAFVALGDDAWHVVDVSFAQWRMTTRRTIALATGMDAATLDHTLALLAQHGFLRQRGPYLVGPRDPSLVLDDLAFHSPAPLERSIDSRRSTRQIGPSGERSNWAPGRLLMWNRTRGRPYDRHMAVRGRRGARDAGQTSQRSPPAQPTGGFGRLRSPWILLKKET